MQARLLLFWLVLVPWPAFAAFQGDWAAADLYAFIGVTRNATTGEILAACAESSQELGAASRAGLNGNARLRALTNTRNILVEEHSRSVYNAYLDACRVDRVDPGTADQQQQLMAEYLRKHRSVSIADHKELFPKFHSQKPARAYAATDFTLHPVNQTAVAEVDTPLVEPTGHADDDAGCGMKLANFRRLFFVLTLGAVLVVGVPVSEKSTPFRSSEVEQGMPPQVASDPILTLPGPVDTGPPKVSPMPQIPKERVGPQVNPPTPPQVNPPHPPPAKPVTPEPGAAGRGQRFRDRLVGTGAGR